MANEGKVAMVQGRIVWVAGDLFKGRAQTIYGTNQPKVNPQTGEQQVQFGFGLAVPKTSLADPKNGAIWTAMYEEAYSMFPSRQIPPSFAMKFKDGDGVDENGVPYNTRVGYANNLVFALTTQLPIRFFKWEGGQNVLVADGIKCGDYVNVQVMVKAHAAIGQGKAGLYLNPMCVQLVAPGEEIVNAPTGDMVFGTAAPVAPAGYVAPTAPAPMPTSALAGAPPAPWAPAPAAPPPHHAVLPPAFQPPVAAAPPGYPSPVAPPAPAMPGPAQPYAVPGAPYPVAPGFPVPR